MKPTNCFDVDGKSVIIAGGSRGLGRELALQLTAQGAHVRILARTQASLDETCREMLLHRRREDQNISASVTDLTDSTLVEALVASLTDAPAILVYVAGGTADEVGFFADITSSHIRNCMERNYFSAAFIAHAMLRRWLAKPSTLQHHMSFTASTAAFLGLPGYAAYTPTKAATRALADTLRQEVLLYQSRQDIRIHCSFPGTILTESFYREQLRKPPLCKELEGSDGQPDGLSAGAVAPSHYHRFAKGEVLNHPGHRDCIIVE